MATQSVCHWTKRTEDERAARVEFCGIEEQHTLDSSHDIAPRGRFGLISLTGPGPIGL